MTIAVVGAGVGRTGTHTLKLALERLVGGRCHHMMEMFGNEPQMAAWGDAIDGRPTDWPALLRDFSSVVDWPGASFWPELSAAFPDALVLLSVRSPESWWKSASNTIFIALGTDPKPPGPMGDWLGAMNRLMDERFSDDLTNPQAMMDAFVRHNEAVRAGVPASRLLEWTPSDGWDPICERLGLAVPDEPLPVTNTTDDFRAMMGLDKV